MLDLQGRPLVATKRTSKLAEPLLLGGPDGRPPVLDMEALERTGPAGLRAFYRIMGLWGLKVDEQMALLDVDARSTFSRWRDVPPAKLGRDRLERISHILGIYKALAILFPNAEAAYQWVTRPNTDTLFGGRRALDLMTEGGIYGLLSVRTYLDAQRGGWA